MADKMKVEEVLKRLKSMNAVLDQQIAAYESAKESYDEAEFVGDADATKTSESAMKVARDKMLLRIAAIDKIIFEESEGKVSESLGLKDDSDLTVKDLNDKIAEILQRVEAVKELGLKTDDGKEIEIRTDTADTLERLDELEATKKDRDYSTIDDDITALEMKVIDADIMAKYDSIKEKIAAEKGIDKDEVDVAKAYKEDLNTIKEKIDTYKKYAALAGFNANSFKMINTVETFTNSINKPKAEKWFECLKSARADEEVTIGGKKIKIGDLKESKEFFAQFEGLNPKEFKKAIAELTKISVVSKDELYGKSDEVRKAVSSSEVLEIFAEDKAEMLDMLKVDPIDTRAIEIMLSGMLDNDDKNFDLLEKLAGDPAEIEKARKELERLKALQEVIKKEAEKEEELRAVKVDPKEIEEVKVLIGKKAYSVEVEKGDYTEQIVELGKSEDYDKVVEATYAGISKADLKKMNDSVELESKSNGDKLPRHIPFFSRFAARFSPDKMTARERAIAARVKNKIRTGIKAEQRTAKEVAAGLTKVGEERATKAKEQATNDKNDLFRVDQETLDRIESVARKHIIEQRGKTTVENAREVASRDD